jgi:hypothetical protein
VRAILQYRWVKPLVIVALLLGGCRAIAPVQTIRPSSAPDISRVELKNGKVTTFNLDLGWYNKKAGTIEGITTDSVHVEYHLSELSKVETVREYSIIPAVFVGGVVIGAVIYLLSQILTHVHFL